MTASDAQAAPEKPLPASPVIVAGYRTIGYFGLMSVSAALVFGFRYQADASWWNYPVDVLLYAAFLAPHLLLTRADVKTSVWGRLAGTPSERQLYILIAIVTWLAVLALQRPLPGSEWELPEAVRFVGMVGFLWALLLFFEGTTWEKLDGLLGVPGSVMQYSHDTQTPLLTEGQYAQVRHPMYRAAALMGLAALVVHPNAAQLLWTIMLCASFLGYIPVEEAQLLAARGNEYRRYCEQTRYRLVRGIW